MNGWAFALPYFRKERKSEPLFPLFLKRAKERKSECPTLEWFLYEKDKNYYFLE